MWDLSGDLGLNVIDDLSEVMGWVIFTTVQARGNRPLAEQALELFCFS